MKCNKCGEYRETAADVMACAGCNDGTNQQLANTDPNTAMEKVVQQHPGVANRFVPGSAPVETPEQSDEPTKEHMDGAIERLKAGQYTAADREYVVNGMRSYYGELLDADAEKRIDEALPPAPTTEPTPEPKIESQAVAEAPVAEAEGGTPAPGSDTQQ